MFNSKYNPDKTNFEKHSGTPNLFFDSRDNISFKKDDNNIIYKVTGTQLPAMVDGAFANLFLTKDNVREPHWHPNAWELNVVVSGKIIFSILDPNTKQVHHYPATNGQVVFIPMGWLHWVTAVSDKVHLHIFLNNEHFETLDGSDMLRLMSPELFQVTYNIDAKQISEALAPITKSVVIGPPIS
ncbi:cupin [Bacillus mycoides]|uniref:Cupin n=2 Tax=Bacillus mycoides TaxID=1405 RepID=A0A1E8AYW1_BACMY|nr:cupin domain-containing protein [Bacillus mycoides]OFD69131.1 cupin [Bacillus mycoides]OFD70438.1 cupin [Bacillus mycoides]OFD71269.1 cupin [Bacillus mycoides]